MDEGEAAQDSFGGALMDAASRGVEVRILIDAGGSMKLRDRALKDLRDAGCHARWVHRDFGRLNVRDHRKIIVIDGRLAFVGGHSISPTTG